MNKFSYLRVVHNGHFPSRPGLARYPLTWVLTQGRYPFWCQQAETHWTVTPEGEGASLFSYRLFDTSVTATMRVCTHAQYAMSAINILNNYNIIRQTLPQYSFFQLLLWTRFHYRIFSLTLFCCTSPSRPSVHLVDILARQQKLLLSFTLHLFNG